MTRTSGDVKKNIKISGSIHKAVRMAVAERGGTIESYVEAALQQKLNSDTNMNDQAAELRKIVNE